MKSGFVAMILAVTVAASVAHAGSPSDNKQAAEYFAQLPVPDTDPSQWQWPSSLSQTTIKMLDTKGPVNPHYPRAVIPINDAYPVHLWEGETPGVGRGHGGMTYVNWTLGMKKMVDLSVDITFHSDPVPKAAVYLQLYDFKIGKTGQYFGFQYRFGDNGQLKTRFIWSRWSTRDKADAWVAEGGTIESAGYEGDFVGVRYPYTWGKGTYTVQVMMRETDAKGTWYEMMIYDHQKKNWTKIGRLRFPETDDGALPFIEDGGGSWCEVFGGTKSSDDIGLFHLSYGGVYTCGRTVAAKEVRFTYAKDTPNSDISLDPDGMRVHVMYGGKTRRLTFAGTYKLAKEKPLAPLGNAGDKTRP
jgi:hypothetical protein